MTMAKRVAARPSTTSSGQTTAAPTQKHLLDYLPAIYHEEPDVVAPSGDDSDQPDKPTYLSLYLLAFERLLFSDTAHGKEIVDEDGEAIGPGLEQEIASLPSLFNPFETPEAFLPWLATWASLSFHPDITLDRRRRLLAEIIPLYSIRGTRTYLEKVLTLCVDAFVSVNDTEIDGFEVGRHSTVGVDTYLGGGPPHFFTVSLSAPKLSDREREIQLGIARSVIELAKPAHTFYELSLRSPQLEIGKHSTVGLDTVLGPASAQG
jgi:phage tail-like protein